MTLMQDMRLTFTIVDDRKSVRLTINDSPEISLDAVQVEALIR